MTVNTFNYHGGKFSKLDWLLPHLPASKIYVELFGGSFAVYFNKRPRSKFNILNDADGHIINLFRQIRDNGDELVRRIELTPYSREELHRCITQDAEDPIERARQTVVVLKQSYMHTTASRGFSLGATNWTASHDSFARFPKHIQAMVSHLKYCYILNIDAVNILSRMRHREDVLFYADPPYLPESRSSPNVYGVEMTEQHHINLLTELNKVKGSVAVSGYDSSLYCDYLRDWRCEKLDTKLRAGLNVKGEQLRGRIECLWMNYDEPKKSINDIIFGG